MNEAGQNINGDRRENRNDGVIEDIVREILQGNPQGNQGQIDNNLVEGQRNLQPDGIENPNVGQNQNIDHHEEGAVGGVENVNMGEGNANPPGIGDDDDDDDDDNNLDDLPDLENVENGNMAPNENPNNDD